MGQVVNKNRIIISNGEGENMDDEKYTKEQLIEAIYKLRHLDEIPKAQSWRTGVICKTRLC